MTYLAAALFFTFVLLAAMVAIHVTVQLNWREILLALRGELGAATASAAPADGLRRSAAI